MSMNRRQALGASLAGLGAWAFSRPANAGDKKRYVQWCQPTCYPPTYSQPCQPAMFLPTKSGCGGHACRVWEYANFGNGFSAYYGVLCPNFTATNIVAPSASSTNNVCVPDSQGNCTHCTFVGTKGDSTCPQVIPNDRHEKPIKKVDGKKDPEHGEARRVFTVIGPNAKDFVFCRIPHMTDNVVIKVRLGVFHVRVRPQGPEEGTKVDPAHVKTPKLFLVGQEIDNFHPQGAEPFDVQRELVSYEQPHRIKVTIDGQVFDVATETAMA